MNEPQEIIRTYLLEIAAAIPDILPSRDWILDQNKIVDGIDYIYLSPKGYDISPIGVAIYLDNIYGYNNLDIRVFTGFNYTEIYRGNLANPNVKELVVNYITMAINDFKKLCPIPSDITNELKVAINLPIYFDI